MSTYFEILDRIKPSFPTPPVDVQPQVESGVLVIENPETARTYVTAPLRTSQLSIDDFNVRVTGRLVEAEKANGNGAYWATEDLQFGLPSVAGGPVNWLHQDRTVIGAITGARMVDKEGAARDNLNPYIGIDATVWKWLWPEHAKQLAEFAAQDKAYWSMECVAPTIQCVGDSGCGREMAYLDARRKTEKACEHVRSGTAVRRFVNPIFQGAAAIVPPTKPGWANAHMGLMREAAALIESGKASPEYQDEVMVASLLGFIQEGAE